MLDYFCQIINNIKIKKYTVLPAHPPNHQSHLKSLSVYLAAGRAIYSSTHASWVNHANTLCSCSVFIKVKLLMNSETNNLVVGANIYINEYDGETDNDKIMMKNMSSSSSLHHLLYDTYHNHGLHNHTLRRRHHDRCIRSSNISR